MSVLSQKHFHDEEAAYEFVEAHIWPNGAVCPHCGETKRVNKLKGKSTRIGVHKCYNCRKPFTVKIGTIFEHSRVKMHLWLQAIFLMASSKKGISSNQLHRTLGVTLKTAWFMSHRIREAMRDGDFDVFGSGGGDVEVDETFIGQDPTANQDVKKKNWVQRNKVLSLVDRESGQVRSCVIKDLKVSTIAPIVSENVSKEARLLTDEAPRLKAIGRQYADHGYTNHFSGEYVNKADRTIHTNTVEGYFSIFKRGMKGVYQHCDRKHLHRYLAEYDFRYNNRKALGVDDQTRANNALLRAVGKRLTYQTASSA